MTHTQHSRTLHVGTEAERQAYTAGANEGDMFLEKDTSYLRVWLSNAWHSLGVASIIDDCSDPPSTIELDTPFGQPEDLPNGMNIFVLDTTDDKLWSVTPFGGDWWFSEWSKTDTGSRYWRALELTPDNVGKPSANPPAVGEYQGFVFDRYDRSTEEQTYYMWHIPGDYVEGDTSVRGHFGFFVENPPVAPAGDEAVVLGFEYKIISEGDVFDFSAGTSDGTITETIADTESAYEWHETVTGSCTTTGWAADDIVLFRFYRDATNPADTYDNEVAAADNDVWVGVYHLEYLSQQLGEHT